MLQGLHWLVTGNFMSNISQKQHFYIPLSELTYLTILKASRQKHSSWQLYSKEKNGLQQYQMESCQPIKRLKDKKFIFLQRLKAKVVFITWCEILRQLLDRHYALQLVSPGLQFRLSQLIYLLQDVLHFHFCLQLQHPLLQALQYVLLLLLFHLWQKTR